MKRRNGVRIGVAVGTVLVALVGAGFHLIEVVEIPEMTAARAESMAYRDQLVRALRENGKVEIIEHSWGGDRPDSGQDDPVIEHQRIELSPELREKLARRIEKMDAAPQIAVAMCFSPHHTIKFSPVAGTPSWMRVCFMCSRVEWDRSEGIPPAALIGLLEKFFAELGLRSRADWAGLAESSADEVRVPSLP